MRNEFALGSRTGMRGSFLALTFADIAAEPLTPWLLTMFIAQSMTLSWRFLFRLRPVRWSTESPHLIEGHSCGRIHLRLENSR
jgi:hypothetical protein